MPCVMVTPVAGRVGGSNCYRNFERPDAYLARVATDAHHAAYVRHRDDCARRIVAVRR
jgi:hypothetical protein